MSGMLMVLDVRKQDMRDTQAYRQRLECTTKKSLSDACGCADRAVQCANHTVRAASLCKPTLQLAALFTQWLGASLTGEMLTRRQWTVLSAVLRV